MKANRVKCSDCALHPLCLPASVSVEEIERLEEIVLQRRPMQRGDRLYNAGEPQRAVFVAYPGQRVPEAHPGSRGCNVPSVRS